MMHFRFFMRSFMLAAGLALALPLFNQTAAAQAPGRGNDDCILDNCRDRQPSTNGGNQRNFDRPYGRDRFQDDRRGERRGGREDRGGDNRGGGERYGSRPGNFDFYVLSLSWSPSFCGSEAGRRSREQCAPGANNAFVVHGLWPQFDRGFPSYCDERNPPRSALDNARGVFPEEGLARYQWRKHGSCSGLAPAAYYDLVRQVKSLVVIPEDMRRPSGPMRKDPSDIQRAFLQANKSLREDMISVTCTRGQLEEVRVCIAKDGKEFKSCPSVANSFCRTGNVAVPAPR